MFGYIELNVYLYTMIQVKDIICSGYDLAGHPVNEFLVTGINPITGIPLNSYVIVPIPWTFLETIKVCSTTN